MKKKKNKKTLLQKLFNVSNDVSTQQALGFRTISSDGTMLLNNNEYARTIEFQDMSYRLASDDGKERILNSYLSFINGFEINTDVQFTFINKKVDTNMLYDTFMIDEKEDSFSRYRKELNDILIDRINTSGINYTKRKFITFKIQEKDNTIVKNKLNQIEQRIINKFKNMQVQRNRLERVEYMNLISDILSTENVTENDVDVSLKQGLRILDMISPKSISFSHSNYNKINESYFKTFYLDILTNELSDTLLSDILNFNENIVVNLTFKKIPLQKAIKDTIRLTTDIDAEIINYQKKASKNGYSGEFISPELANYKDEVGNLLEEFQKNNENYFLATLLLTIKGDTKEEIDRIFSLIDEKVQEHSCHFSQIFNINDKVLKSIIPSGYNNLELERGLTGKNVTTLIPFTSQELIMINNDSLNYGINSLSKNIIMIDRKEFQNASGLILGTPGSGKSFTAKQELLNTFLVTDDDILVVDPEDEYSVLCKELGGEIVDINTYSNTYINPFDVPVEISDDTNNIIKTKSLFIISMIEILIGGLQSLDSSQISVIDRVLNKIYNNFYAIEHRTSRDMPTFQTFYDELLKNSKTINDTAYQLASQIDIYVNGSLNLFNNQTNINVNNRFITFNLKGLTGVLSDIGMFIVQDYIYNRTYENFEKNKWTRIYFDEFHRVLRKEKSAEYIRDMFKTFRKRGGILTGITQNVSDFLESDVAKTILKNISFALLLNQNTYDIDILSDFLGINNEQQAYLINTDVGEGLLVAEGVIIPFKNQLKSNTQIYKMITTKFSERK